MPFKDLLIFWKSLIAWLSAIFWLPMQCYYFVDWLGWRWKSNYALFWGWHESRQAGRQEEVKIQTESTGMVLRQAFQKKVCHTIDFFARWMYKYMSISILVLSKNTYLGIKVCCRSLCTLQFFLSTLYIGKLKENGSLPTSSVVAAAWWWNEVLRKAHTSGWSQKTWKLKTCQKLLPWQGGTQDCPLDKVMMIGRSHLSKTNNALK